MQLIIDFLTNFYTLTLDMAIYIIFGIIFAGILKQVIPKDFVSKQLGNNNYSSVIKASLFGIPLPLCSCSVIPFATSLKKEGASSGSVLSFLISTPITGADSILATYGFFGWLFTIYRVITSLIIAMVAGILQNLISKETIKEEIKECTTCCCGTSCNSEVNKFSIKEVFNYAIFEVFKDFAKPLFWGLIAGSIITTFMPTNMMEYLSSNIFITYLLILIFSMTLYICATASLPIAAGLIASGLSGGAAFILLSAGPATNSVTMGVVLKTLGKKALIIYLSTIGIFSLIFAYIFDIYFPNILNSTIINQEESFGIFSHIFAIIMLIMIAYFLLVGFFKRKFN
jgi:hypothetical protein